MDFFWKTNQKITPFVIDKRNPALIIANHPTIFEPFCLAYYATLKPILFVAKKELAKKFFIGYFGFFNDVTWIDRGNSKQTSAAFLHLARKAIKEKAIIAIFPEGQRSNSDTMLPFKAPVFQFAKLIKANIYPLKILNSLEIFASQKKTVKIKINFLKPIPFSHYRKQKAEDIAKNIWKQMEKSK